MLRYKTSIFLIFLLSFISIFLTTFSYSAESNSVFLISLDDETINPVTAEFIINSIDEAEQTNAQCIIIELDTPGGLLKSTRMIVKHILQSDVPVIVYISPGGSRAGSAGVFITYASHIAAMAPSTNIGAAHPVQIGKEKLPSRGFDWDKLKEIINEEKSPKTEDVEQKKAEDFNRHISSPVESKILKDTVAFIKALAYERGRNSEWAVKSVVESASITQEEALEKGVINLIANDRDDLLQKINGMTINIKGKERILDTEDRDLTILEMDSRQKLFNIFANPNIAYFLLILGFYGLFFEVTNPGFGVPGVVGLIFLIVALYSMQTLPTNYAGLALIILGLVFFITEIYIPGFGIFTFGGLICLVLGSMLLFDTADPVMRVSRTLIYSLSITTSVGFVLLMGYVLKGRKNPVIGGKEGLLNAEGEVTKKIFPDSQGQIFVHGEIWNAESNEILNPGDKVVVTSLHGLVLTVKKLNN